jgi:mannosyltransferase
VQVNRADAAGAPAAKVPGAAWGSTVRGRWAASTASWQSPGIDWLLAGLAMVLGGWLRWWGLGRQSLWVDEMSSFGMADTGLRQIIPTVLSFDGHPPFYIFLVHIAHFNLGMGTVDSVRVPSLVAGVLTIPVVYGLARLLVGRLGAVLTTALVIVSPVIVWYSREGRMYAVTWLFVMFSFLLLVQAVRSRRAAWLVPYGLAVALSLYSDISAVMAIVPQAAIIGWFLFRGRSGERGIWLRVAGAYAAGWISFVPWLLVLPRQLHLLHGTFPGYEPNLATAWRLVLNLSGLEATYASIYGIAVPTVLAVALLLFYVFAIVGCVLLGRHHRLFTATALVLTLGPAVMCAAFLAVGSPGVMLPRVMGLAAFGLALTLGGTIALAWAALRPRSGALLAVGAAGLIALATTSLALAAVEAHGYNGEDWRSVARLLEAKAGPYDAVIYYPYGVKIMVDPYLPAGSRWLHDANGLWAAPHDVAEADFARWSAGHIRVWMVFYAAGAIDMPVHDAWFRANGFILVAGDPTAGSGVLEYVALAAT